MEENEVTGSCANGVCTVHGPSGKSEYSEVFEKFVPAFFAGAQVKQTFPSACYNPTRKHEIQKVSNTTSPKHTRNTHCLSLPKHKCKHAHTQTHSPRTIARTYTRKHIQIHKDTCTHSFTLTHKYKHKQTHTSTNLRTLQKKNAHTYLHNIHAYIHIHKHAYARKVVE